METHYFNVDHTSYELNQTGSFEYYFTQEDNGDAVVVLTVTDDGMIPLIERYRTAGHRRTLEIPAGHANNPSGHLTGVARHKLAEETGFNATKLVQSARFMNMPGYSTQHIAIFFATGLIPASCQEIGPETPCSNVRMASVDDTYETMANDTIMDAKTMVTTLRLKSNALDHLND